jgi:hypothetical protein
MIYKLTEKEASTPSQTHVQNVPNRHALIQALVKSTSITRNPRLSGSQLSA